MKKLILLLVLTVLLISCKKEPDVDFSYTGKPEVQETLAFTNLSSNCDSYIWNFGDGSSSTSESPSHAYSKPGVYQVMLTAEGHGKTVSLTKPISITGTTFSFTNNTGAILYNFFTFYSNATYIEEYTPQGFLDLGQSTKIIKTNKDRISFSFRFIPDADIFICAYPYRLHVGEHNNLIITDTISIYKVTISSKFLKNPGNPGTVSYHLKSLVR